MKPYLSYISQLFRYLRRKGREILARLAQQPPLRRIAQLETGQPHPVNIGHPERVVILLVGCGGTGSHCAHILAQLAGWAKSVGLDLRLYFIDPDTIEPKNLIRQNFCPAEVGYPKAFSLAWRYSAAFGLAITPVVEPFSAELLNRYAPRYAPQGTLTLIVGAVDNVCARRDIAEAVTEWLQSNRAGGHRLWWLDCGNERDSGQLLIGNSLEPEPLLSPLGYCTHLPLPHIQEPSLLAEREGPPVDLSCAELTVLEEQSAMINRLMAGWAGVYLYRLLQSRDLTMQATWLNLATGRVRSVPIKQGRTVLPERPRRIPVTAQRDAPGIQCPTCGGQLISGQDEWQGVLVGVRFCTDCHYREEVCPVCEAEIVEEMIEVGGRGVTGLVCVDNCGWQEAIQPLAETADI